MRDHDDGASLFDQLLKYLKDGFSRERIQAAGRFICNDDGWVIGKRTGDGNTLLLASRNISWQLICMVLQLHQLEQLHSTLLADPPLIVTAEIHGQHDVLHQVEHGQQLKRLVDDAHVAPTPHGHGILAQLVDGGALPVWIMEYNLTGRDHVCTGDHIEQGSLACPRLADHPHELTRVKVGRDALEGGEITCGGIVYLDHLA